MKKTFVLSSILVLLLWSGIIQAAETQKVEASSSSPNFSEFLKGLTQQMNQSVSSLAADLGFDYQERPIVGILVSDFYNTKGEEIEIGNQIALELRGALNRGNQFHVYGKDHPVSQSLKASLQADLPWSTLSQRNFQQILYKKFKLFPVDLIIIGQVSQESETRLKVTTKLIPFYKPISLVESERARTDIRTEHFFSSPLSSQEMEKGLSVIQIPTVAKGRLVILASLKPQISPKALSLNNINCWLDDKEISVVKEWEDFNKKKEYHDILGGFGAETLWFDDVVVEGPHSFFLSLAQSTAKNKFKNFSKPFFIKRGTSNYLLFSISLDATGEPDLKIRYILDPENRSTPF